MSPKVLLENALVITDAHYSDARPKLLELLGDIESGRISVSQLILMGDIFDMLFAPIALTCKRNHEAIRCLNAIAEKIPVLYFEGNHDFQIAPLFPKIEVIPISKQPLLLSFNNKKILVAHGDFGSVWHYRLYTTIIRSKVVLYLLSLVNTASSNALITRLDRYLKQKEDCREIVDFETLIRRRFEAIPLTGIDVVIEGHFHQNRTFILGNCRYVNLGAFACNERYYIVKSSQDGLGFEEFAYS